MVRRNSPQLISLRVTLHPSRSSPHRHGAECTRRLHDGGRGRLGASRCSCASRCASPSSAAALVSSAIAASSFSPFPAPPSQFFGSNFVITKAYPTGNGEPLRPDPLRPAPRATGSCARGSLALSPTPTHSTPRPGRHLLQLLPRVCHLPDWPVLLGCNLLDRRPRRVPAVRAARDARRRHLVHGQPLRRADRQVHRPRFGSVHLGQREHACRLGQRALWHPRRAGACRAT